ncbi:7805_t:CDS:2, partial [Entrophospora sp. SA101]
SKELIAQKNRLSQELAEFAEPTQLENKVTLLENQIFASSSNYQDQEKITQFKQELAKIDQEFTKLTEEDGSIDYQVLENYLQEQGSKDGFPNKEHKKKIKDSHDGRHLAKNILEAQEERIFNYHDRNYFENFIDQELKKSPAVNVDELGIYSSYAQEISKIKKLERLENYSEKVINKIYQVRKSKISSLSEAQDQAKKNINRTFQRTKIKVQELHQQYQNWQAKIEKLEDISEIFEFEQNLVFFLEKINYYLSQTRPIGLINDLLEKAKELGEISLNDEQIELKQILKKTIDSLDILSDIKGFQREFNNVASTKRKQEMLERIQGALQKLTEIRELTEKEIKIKKKVEQNFRLIKQGKDTQKFILINERQAEIELLTLEKESQAEDGFTTENNNDQD